jgi:hypothetical protein
LAGAPQVDRTAGFGFGLGFATGVGVGVGLGADATGFGATGRGFGRVVARGVTGAAGALVVEVPTGAPLSPELARRLLDRSAGPHPAAAAAATTTTNIDSVVFGLVTIPKSRKLRVRGQRNARTSSDRTMARG